MPRPNDAVAAMLQEFSELLAISGGDQFKVRVYEKAARAVAGYAADVATLDEKGLDAIPGVGSHLARKIVEFRTTGSVGELDDLRAKVPAGLRTLLTVPGLGPKRARQIYDTLGITSVSALDRAIKEHRLQELHGWGEKSEENLERAIHETRVAGGAIPLAVAVDLADELLAELRAVTAVVRAECAGSVRRGRATIGDLDLLVASRDAERVMHTFTASDHVGRVVAHGRTKSTVVTTGGVQVDLRVIEPDVWGAALLYFTGSKAHNIRIRDLALRRGMKLSEYGLFDAETDEVIVAKTEEEVYSRLGLPWIPPMIREDTGEIEAAIAGQLPTLVELRNLRGDLHIHTDLTDGVAPLEDMVNAARARGYRYCAITDHAPLLFMQRMTADKMLEQRQRLRELETQTGMALLHGTELNIQPDGSLDWDDEFLAGFDLVIASVHSQFHQSSEEMTARIVRAMENPHVHLIGHPTGRSIGHRPPVDLDLDEIFRTAARTGTALEINAFPDRLDLSDDLVRRARGFGVRFAIDTDAHAVPHLDYIRYGVATAQRGWAEPGDIINTWPLAKLRRRLARRTVSPRG